MNRLDRLAIVEHLASRRRILEKRTKEFRPIALCFVRADHNLNSKWKRSSLYDRDRLGMTQFRNEKRVLRVAALHCVAQMHRFRRCRTFVEERRIRDWKRS